MRYCGIAVGQGYAQLCVLEEMRTAEPPVRLAAVFFEPGTVGAVAAQVHQLAEVVVAIAGAMTLPSGGRPERHCDEALARRGVRPNPQLESARRLFEDLADMGLYRPNSAEVEGPVHEGAFRRAAVFETNADAVFYALRGRRLPARRHPVGMRLRIDELVADQVLDESGDLWNRRVEEIDATAAALCAHRYAVGHASWIGDPAEGVVVLPGARIAAHFTTHGVLPPVERVRLPEALQP